jgi:hypothetical protein
VDRKGKPSLMHLETKSNFLAYWELLTAVIFKYGLPVNIHKPMLTEKGTILSFYSAFVGRICDTPTVLQGSQEAAMIHVY